ncbi:unnamed protein product, partial [Dicrocoelium dendriticum]
MCCVDNICVFGGNPTEHQENLPNVLHRVNKLNLRLNTSKCQCAVTEVEIIGHVQNTRSIFDCSTRMKHFLGLCSYDLRDVPNFATIAELLQRLSRQNQEFRLAFNQDNAYMTIRTMTESTPTVAIFNEHALTFVSTDASDVGLGAVLSQLRDVEEKVIAYASRTVSDAERNYSTGDKKALACAWHVRYGTFTYSDVDSPCAPILLL